MISHKPSAIPTRLPQSPSSWNQLGSEIFDNLPFAVYMCDSLGYVTSFNAKAVELWGRTPEIGKDLWCGSWKIFTRHGEPMLLSQCPMARALKQQKAIEGEDVIIQRQDGTQINVLPYPVPLFDDQGVLTGAINTLVDITHQKSSTAEKNMMAAIVRSSDDAIISKTLNGIITSWNEAAERIFGYTSGETIGKSITLLIPEDRLSEEDTILARLRKGEKIDHYETWRLTKDKVQIPVSLTISPIKDEHGTVVGASKIARDISRQKAFESRLNRYTENIEVLNTIGKIVSGSLNIESILQNVTDATTQLTGAAFGAFFYNKLDSSGESYRLYTLSGVPKEAFEKFGMPRNTAIFNPTFTGQSIIRSDDITKDARYGKNHPHYGMPKGHLPVISYLAVPVISVNGTVMGGLFYGHPEAAKFTEDHETLLTAIASQASIALDNAYLYEEITKLNQKKDEFIGLASHELKTPLSSVYGYLQLIEKNLPNDDRNRNFVNRALVQLNKLTKLVSDLLDVSKIETGKLPLSFSEFDLIQLVKEVVEYMHYTNRTHQISVHDNVKELSVLADRERIEQVIINLLTNAIKYSPKATQVNVFVSAGESKNACLAVQDFGLGINAEQQKKIFSRFYRVDDLDVHMSGLGLGLYISKEIIDRHGGSLMVESVPGKGSTFSVELPSRGKRL